MHVQFPEAQALAADREQELLERISSQESMLKSAMDYMSEVQRQLEQQKAMLEHRNREVMDSIHYAKLIQDAIMPDLSELQGIVADHFILHRQRDIIGGDFPYVRRSGNYLYVAVVDCVGHGVPGAILSSMVHFALNEVLLRNSISALHEVPTRAFDLITQNIGHSGGRALGFDIALVRIELTTREVEFCGAGRPAYLMHSGKITEFKGSRFGLNMDHQVDLRTEPIPAGKGDRIYLFSDGFSDQFGGPRDRKFSSSQFRKLLASTGQLRMKKQKEILNGVWMDWKRSSEQTDDILVIGIQT